MANNPFGGKMPTNMADIMKAAQQAQKMMEQARQTEEELGGIIVEGSAAGGVVTVRVTGKGDILDIKIDPVAVDPTDVVMLQDLVVTAVREAMDKATALRTERMQGIVPPGLNMPGLF